MVKADRFFTPSSQFPRRDSVLQLYRAPIPGFFIVGRVETGICNSMLNLPPPIGKDRRSHALATQGPRRGGNMDAQWTRFRRPERLRSGLTWATFAADGVFAPSGVSDGHPRA